jgi:hypothetical protein
MNPSIDEITISNFNTIPQKINSQDEYRIQVTVTNNLNMPITYRGDMCGGSPLDIQFDKNVGPGNVNTKITFNYEVPNGDAQEKHATKSFLLT